MEIEVKRPGRKKKNRVSTRGGTSNKAYDRKKYLMFYLRMPRHSDNPLHVRSIKNLHHHITKMGGIDPTPGEEIPTYHTLLKWSSEDSWADLIAQVDQMQDETVARIWQVHLDLTHYDLRKHLLQASKGMLDAMTAIAKYHGENPEKTELSDLYKLSQTTIALLDTSKAYDTSREQAVAAAKSGASNDEVMRTSLRIIEQFNALDSDLSRLVPN